MACFYCIYKNLVLYKIAACFNSFLMALLIKSLMVVPVAATTAATRE